MYIALCQYDADHLVIVLSVMLCIICLTCLTCQTILHIAGIQFAMTYDHSNDWDFEVVKLNGLTSTPQKRQFVQSYFNLTTDNTGQLLFNVTKPIDLEELWILLEVKRLFYIYLFYVSLYRHYEMSNCYRQYMSQMTMDMFSFVVITLPSFLPRSLHDMVSRQTFILSMMTAATSAL